TSTGVFTPIAGATAFSNKFSGTDVIYGVGIDGKINDTIKYRVDFERIKADGDIDSTGISMLYNF
ncbi:autotransporter outer membrane beta-barrel domain-containing protein, partial [Bathymodiolus azoricus thioautotrophic gill symbiont]|uniref:autotransporter outer membrane beta-barrel domain-containing protein n=1 Tax=Bathymodiolus azoricus thioautotrophic gill symbiont TaxID=235205 RepID=UPI001177BF0F